MYICGCESLLYENQLTLEVINAQIIFENIDYDAITQTRVIFISIWNILERYFTLI